MFREIVFCSLFQSKLALSQVLTIFKRLVLDSCDNHMTRFFFFFLFLSIGLRWKCQFRLIEYFRAVLEGVKKK